ncbi:MAG: hypothetical protein ACYC3X_11510 [Pirellulaceae bacterium]
MLIMRATDFRTGQRLGHEVGNRPDRIEPQMEEHGTTKEKSLFAAFGVRRLVAAFIGPSL